MLNQSKTCILAASKRLISISVTETQRLMSIFAQWMRSRLLAFRAFRAVFAYVKGFESLMSLSQLYSEIGDHSSSAKCAAGLVENFPDKILGYERYAQELIYQGKLELAEKVTFNGLSRFPNATTLLDIRFEVCLKTNRLPMMRKCTDHLFSPYDYNYLIDYRSADTGHSDDYKSSLTNEYPQISNSLECNIARNAVIPSIYGIYDQQGNPFQEGFVWRGERTSITDFPLGGQSKINTSIYPHYHEINAAIWVRYFESKHFGHLLTETCSAIYTLLIWKSMGFNLEKITIVVPSKHESDRQYLAFLLGISCSNIYLSYNQTNPLMVRILYIPKPTVVNRTFFSPKHAMIVRIFLELLISISIKSVSVSSNALRVSHHHAQHKSLKTKKLYISRLRLSPLRRKFLDEEMLERELLSYGWSILYPEFASIEEQLKLYRSAHLLGGVEGSAFHLLMGVKDPSFKVILLSTIRGAAFSSNFELQFESQGIEYILLQCLIRTGRKIGADRDVELCDSISPPSLAAQMNRYSS